MKNIRSPLHRAALALAFVLCGIDVQAQVSVVITPTPGGADAVATISVSGPGGPYDATFTLGFGATTNLTVPCLGISATYLDGPARAAVEARMPQSGLVIDPLFPVLISVSPPAACGLAFENEVDVDLTTAELLFTNNSAYRLFKAPSVGTFRNITRTVTSGSVRARGSSGGFSDFVIVRDDAPDVAADTITAYDALALRLNDPDIDPVARRVLEDQLALSRAAFGVANFAAAADHLDELSSSCGSFAGDELENDWRSLGDLENDEGELISHIDPITFGLDRLANP